MGLGDDAHQVMLRDANSYTNRDVGGVDKTEPASLRSATILRCLRWCFAQALLLLQSGLLHSSLAMVPS
jgi:hypothetical protein